MQLMLSSCSILLLDINVNGISKWLRTLRTYIIIYMRGNKNVFFSNLASKRVTAENGKVNFDGY